MVRFKSLKLTFSPIIVLSPDFSISTSGFKAQALIVLSYLDLSIFFPNKTLFLREAFWIQACCGTYAEVPCYNKYILLLPLCNMLFINKVIIHNILNAKLKLSG